MRVCEQLGALPPDDQQLVLNQLTVGCGRLVQAARLMLTDAPCGHILRHLHAILAALGDLRERLAAAAEP